MSISLDAANALESAIDGKIKKAATGRRRASGTVTRVDRDGTVYAVLDSGIETVVEGLTASVNPGDTVSVTVENGRAEVLGNYSDPSAGVAYVRAVEGIAQESGATAHAAVDSAKAARQIADEAQKVAEATNQHFFHDDNGAHITDVTQDEWAEAVDDDFSDYDPDTKPYHNQLLNSLGILLRTALNNLVSITRSAIAFYDGTGNAASNIVARFGSAGAQIGKSGAAHSVIDADGQRFYTYVGGPLLLANIGYGEGASTTGTGNAPYYSMGLRTPRSVIGNYSMAEGYNTTASGSSSHAEGTSTVASGRYAHAEGVTVTAGNDGSHAEGGWTSSDGAYSHAEGQYATASGYGSHAEGYGVSSYYATASGYGAHAEGYARTANIVASGDGSHAEGVETQATARGAHSEGISSIASGLCSHAQNFGTKAASDYQTALGRYNVEDASDKYALIIGNGTDDANRSNAFAVDWDGGIYVDSHDSPIGTVLETGQVTYSGAMVANTMKQGASLSLTAGTWLLVGLFTFGTASTSGARNISCDLFQGTVSGTTVCRQRVVSAAANESFLQAIGVVAPTATTSYSIGGSSSVATNQARYSSLTAVRIA